MSFSHDLLAIEGMGNHFSKGFLMVNEENLDFLEGIIDEHRDLVTTYDGGLSIESKTREFIDKFTVISAAFKNTKNLKITTQYRDIFISLQFLPVLESLDLSGNTFLTDKDIVELVDYIVTKSLSCISLLNNYKLTNATINFLQTHFGPQLSLQFDHEMLKFTSMDSTILLEFAVNLMYEEGHSNTITNNENEQHKTDQCKKIFLYLIEERRFLPAYSNLAYLYVKKENAKELALKTFQEGFQLRDNKCTIELYQIYEENKYDLLIEKNPQKALFYYEKLSNQSKGDILRRKANKYHYSPNAAVRDYNKALAYYQQALELLPNNSGILASIAELYATGDESVVSTSSEGEVDENSERIKTPFLKNLDLAIEKYKESISYGGKCYQQLLNLYLIEKHDITAAVSFYLQLIEEKGKKEFCYPLAELYVTGEEKNYGEAIKYYEKTIQEGLNNNSKSCYYSIALCYKQLGNKEQEMNWLKKGCEKGEEKSMIALATIYESDISRYDLAEAIRLYRLSDHPTYGSRAIELQKQLDYHKAEEEERLKRSRSTSSIHSAAHSSSATSSVNLTKRKLFFCLYVCVAHAHAFIYDLFVYFLSRIRSSKRR
jgi:TPR repeat protein